MKSLSRVLLSVLTALCLAIPARAQINEYAYPDMYLQYVPITADLGLGLVGVPSEHAFWERLIAAGIGVASEVVLVNSLKAVVDEMRPDGSSANSFPSGHTATAFLGAELVRHEYGWGWGAGAYAVATSVAVLRVVHQRHWWWDTLAGAGAGILCANIGYWLLEPAKDLLGIKTTAGQMALCPTVDPYSGAVCASFSLRF